ncbi:putative stress response protein Rds1 [Talaromyces proteolyticus]|uniref:Stress response protein Rds1 n=1 Tax=Talaromyces proteolyticus TaxID=1131652 RepID=A0AAD4PXA4_9EURO|nr:putative stress response protein Rds1 [Talaromyces proteolyticus]KAH8696184.1 putative stress response protein Rds1 [Talaromyces proteolyticus]
MSLSPSLYFLLSVALAAPKTSSVSTSTTSSTTTTITTTASSSAAPIHSHPSSVYHGSYSGTPTTTGELRATSVGTGVSVASPGPAATTYPSDGKLHDAQPAPYVPAGGVGLNKSPVYNVKSDFDYQSLALGLYQEYIELDLFRYGLTEFSASDFDAAGLSSVDRYLIEFMAEQEIGHATLLSNILGDEYAPSECAYNYPAFASVREYVDFCQKLTRWGESGVYGFLPHLESREAAQLLLQSISTEARQQLIFRQFEGLFPMPVWFEVGIPQSWAWTLLAPYVSSCPANQTRLVWQNFPALNIINNPVPAYANATPAITQNRSTPLSQPGGQVNLVWDAPGKPVGPNNSYITSTSAGRPAYVAWVTQLNVTYSALTISNSSCNNGKNITYASTTQPNLETFSGDPAINGTIFIAVTDDDPFLTSYNLSLINDHVVAGPAVYQAG